MKCDKCQVDSSKLNKFKGLLICASCLNPDYDYREQYKNGVLTSSALSRAQESALYRCRYVRTAK